VPEFCGPLPEGPGPTSSSGSLPALRVARRCSPVGFDRQQNLSFFSQNTSLSVIICPQHRKRCYHLAMGRALLYASRWQREKAAPRTPRARDASWATAHQIFLLSFFFTFWLLFWKIFKFEQIWNQNIFQIWINLKFEHFSNLNKNWNLNNFQIWTKFEIWTIFKFEQNSNLDIFQIWNMNNFQIWTNFKI
jgi:hypothetical protein